MPGTSYTIASAAFCCSNRASPLQRGAVSARAQSPGRRVTRGGLGGWLPRSKTTRCSWGCWWVGSHTDRWLHSPRFALESSSLGASKLSWPHAQQLDCNLTSESPPCLAVSPPRGHTGPAFSAPFHRVTKPLVADGWPRAQVSRPHKGPHPLLGDPDA